MNATFARITETHDCLAFQVYPCARFLYHWLLRNARTGTPQEIELDQFIAFTASGRYRPYSLKQVQRSLNQLTNIGLVKVAKKYTSTIFKLIAFHPDQANAVQNESEVSKLEPLMSKKEASNPDSLVPINREFREHTDISPPTLPVVVEESGQIGIDFDGMAIASEDQVVLPSSDEPEKTLITPQSSKTDSLDQTSQNSLNRVKELIAPQRLHGQLQKLILETDLSILEDAIAVVKENQAKSQVKNPTGLLVRAIKGKWVPASPVKAVVDEFKPWYEQAYKSGLIERFTSNKAEITGLQDGVLCVMPLSTGRWVPWLEMK